MQPGYMPDIQVSCETVADYCRLVGCKGVVTGDIVRDYKVRDSLV